jgi:hypothetical protein
MRRLPLAAIVAIFLPGCAGLHNTCRYGSAQNSTGNTCRSRPKPSDEQVRAASTGAALRNALAAWKRHPRFKTVNGVGVNWWGETTFTIRTALNGPKELTLVTFDAAGKPTSNNEDYVTGHDDPFRVGIVRPEVIGNVMARIHEHQPDVRFLTASLTVAPFIDRPAWSIQVVSLETHSTLVYQVFPDGKRLCHGKDGVPDDALTFAPGIKRCPNPVFANT